MTEREQALYDWLHQACALLSVEAQDHEHNSQMDRKKRQEIAKILRQFLVQAANVLDDAKELAE